MRMVCLFLLAALAACSRAPGGDAAQSDGAGAASPPPPVVVSDGVPTSLTPPTFAGTWGADITACKTPQDLQGAPMLVTETGYDQHETHCTFSKVEKTGTRAWKMNAACSVEGDVQEFPMSLALEGEGLVLDMGTGPGRLMRCP